MIFSCIRDLIWEAIVPSVDIGGIVDHHCLNYLYIFKAEIGNRNGHHNNINLFLLHK